MKPQKSLVIGSLILIFLTVSIAPAKSPVQIHAENKTWRIPQPCNFRSDMRRLWENHVYWTRAFIISTLANLPDRESVTKRLLQNQKDIGKSLEIFYGPAVADRLTKLLTENILQTTDLVLASKVNALKVVEASSRKLLASGDDIAQLLHSANPKIWPLKKLSLIMHDHLMLTTEQLNARVRMDWEADAIAYHKVQNNILDMSDHLAFGIIEQFESQ